MIAVSIDGVLIDAADAKISVFDRGLLHGDGCFEVLRTWNGAPRDLEDHLDRLLSTARFLALVAPSRGMLVETVRRTLAATARDPGERKLRIVLTRGPGSVTTAFSDLPPGHTIVIVEPLPPQPTTLSLAIVDWPVASSHREGRKTLAYLDALIARELARQAGADEALRLDGNGDVVEGATCNVFGIADGTVVTPATDGGALPGIVRARVLALCDLALIPTEIRRVSVADVHAANEIFVTSSLRGVVAVTRFEGTPRCFGPLTERLAREYTTVMQTAT